MSGTWLSSKASDVFSKMASALADKVKSYALSPDVQDRVISAAKNSMQRVIESAQNMMFNPENQKKILAFTEKAIDRAKEEFDRHQPKSLKRMHRIAVAVTVVALIVLIFMIVGSILNYVALSRALDHSSRVQEENRKLKETAATKDPSPAPLTQ